MTGNACSAGSVAIGAQYTVTGSIALTVNRYEASGATQWVVAVVAFANNQTPTLSVRTICLNT